jgi:hypothetical protein
MMALKLQLPNGVTIQRAQELAWNNGAIDFLRYKLSQATAALVR